MKTDDDLYSHPSTWVAWSVNWSAIWVGALAAVVFALIFGLVGTAIGATSTEKLASWRDVSRIDVAVAICTAFFSFVIGGWAAARISGMRHAEPAILHGAIAWLVATPLVVALLAAGAGNALGGWYGGLAAQIGSTAAVADPEVVRNTALAALTAVLVGLVGSVIGGWMGSGEPMTFTHYRKRNAYFATQKGRI